MNELTGNQSLISSISKLVSVWTMKTSLKRHCATCQGILDFDIQELWFVHLRENSILCLGGRR